MTDLEAVGEEQENTMRLGLVTYLVRDYDESIAWFRDRLGFTLAGDTDLGDGKRWVEMTPPKSDATKARGARLLLAKAVGPEQTARIGDQAGGRVAFFLYTDDIARDRARMERGGVEFIEPVRSEAYGKVCVFKDLYGAKWDLVELDRL
jgi:catechol 2,3-dioxygenase-like lactoylglutathione lyase family enzyme